MYKNQLLQLHESFSVLLQLICSTPLLQGSCCELLCMYTVEGRFRAAKEN